jgi:hypothetical protein
MTASPTLILGGFLITPEAYEPMATAIAVASNQPVEVVPVSRGDWLLTNAASGWRRVLDRCQSQMDRLAQHSPSGQVNLVGHSSGGVMLRVLLGDEPFAGRVYGERHRVGTLLTLGSPHKGLRATALRQRVHALYPGAWFADQLRYVAVAGCVDPQRLKRRARWLVGPSYQSICGDSTSRGDGLVPVGSALLDGAEPCILEDVGHGGWFANRWYGSEDVLSLWIGLLNRGAT